MDGAHPRFWAWIPPSWPRRQGVSAFWVGERGLRRPSRGSGSSPGGFRPDDGTPRTHAGRSSTPAACRCPLRASAWDRVWQPQPRDPVEEVAEQLARHGNLGHLEDRVPAVGDYLRADLDHLLSQRGKGPPLDLTG